MKFLARGSITFFLLLFFSASCGGPVFDSSVESEGVVLPDFLAQVADTLTGEISVYDSEGNREIIDDMLFDTDDDGNDIAVTPPMTLNRGETYRFIIVFYDSGEPIAHVDLNGTIADAATTNLTYTQDDIINNSEDVDDILLSAVSKETFFSSGEISLE